MKQLASLSIITGFLLGGCTLLPPALTNANDTIEQAVNAEQQKQTDKTAARVKCQQLCQDTLLADGVNFEVGPCLSNSVAPDWVCDVAHSPRQTVDDDPANQCASFRSGQVGHFVEVDGNCNVIQAR